MKVNLSLLFESFRLQGIAYLSSPGKVSAYFLALLQVYSLQMKMLAVKSNHINARLSYNQIKVFFFSLGMCCPAISRLKGKSAKLHYSNVAVGNKFQYAVSLLQALQVHDYVLLMYNVNLN